MRGTIVRDVMTPLEGYSAVSDEATLEEAIKVLQTSFYRDERGISFGHTSVLVADKAGQLTGVLTVKSILRAIDQKSAELGLPLGGLFTQPPLLHRTLAQIAVGAVMSPVEKAGVKDDESAGRAIRKLLENGASTLPVISEGKAVGIIRPIDVLQSIGQALGEKQDIILSFLTVS